MSYIVGLDLHSNNTFVGIVDQDGTPVYLHRHRNLLPSILGVLKQFEGEISGIAVESTYNWYWLVDGLMEAGYPVHLAHTGDVADSRLKYTCDATDALGLADRLRKGELREGFILPPAERSVRDLLRERVDLVHHRTGLILSVQTVHARELGCGIGSDHLKRLPPEETVALFSKPFVREAVRSDLRLIHEISVEILRIEDLVRPFVRPQPVFEKLKTIPGVGDILAMTILLETGPISRFPQVGHFASYCRCVQSVRTSNEKKKGVGNRKNGNRFLAWAFLEAAHHAQRWSPQAQAFVQRKLRKRPRVVAYKALAHKLARAAFYILRDGVEWDAAKAFGTP